MEALSAEEQELIRFVRASKAAKAAKAAAAAAGAKASAGAQKNTAQADDDPPSNPSSPVADPPAGEGGEAAEDIDDALFSFDVDAAVAAAAPRPAAEGAAVAAEEEEDDDFLNDEDFIAELLHDFTEQDEAQAQAQAQEQPPALPTAASAPQMPAAPAAQARAAPAAHGRPRAVAWGPMQPADTAPQPRTAARFASSSGSSSGTGASGSGGILRRREPAPVAAAAATVPGEREEVETSSRLRLQDGRSLSTTAMRGLTAAHPHFNFKDINRRVHDIGGPIALSEMNWCTIGVVTNKSEKRPTKSGAHFRTLHFTDMALAKGTSVCVLLTQDACKNTRVQEGGVYALLEPEIQQEKRQAGSGFILVVSKSESVYCIGRSKDFVPCRQMKKDNTQCGNYVDRRVNDLCPCHIEQAFKALKTDRMNLNNQGLSCSRQIHQRKEDQVRQRTHGRRLPASRMNDSNGVASKGWQPRLGEKSLSVVGSTYQVDGVTVQPNARDVVPGMITMKKVLESQEKAVQRHAAGTLAGPTNGYKRGNKMMEAAKIERKRKAEAQAKARQLMAERKRQKQSALDKSGLSAAVSSRIDAREEKVFGCGGNHGNSAAVRLNEAKKRARSRSVADTIDTSDGYVPSGQNKRGQVDGYLPSKKYTNGSEKAGAIGRSASAKWQQQRKAAAAPVSAVSSVRMGTDGNMEVCSAADGTWSSSQTTKRKPTAAAASSSSSAAAGVPHKTTKGKRSKNSASGTPAAAPAPAEVELSFGSDDEDDGFELEFE